MRRPAVLSVPSQARNILIMPLGTHATTLDAAMI